MKKRILSFFLLVVMLVTMIPVAANAAEETGVKTPATNAEYAKLYVQDGLVAAYMAYGADATDSYSVNEAPVDGVVATWYDLIGDNDASVVGNVKSEATPSGWYVGANGGFATDDKTTYTNTANKITIPLATLKDEGGKYLSAYTVEFVGKVDIRTVPYDRKVFDNPVGVTAEDGKSTTYTMNGITAWNYNGGGDCGLYGVTISGAANTAYTVTIMGSARALTTDANGEATYTGRSYQASAITVVTPEGVTVKTAYAAMYSSANEACQYANFAFGTLYVMHWSNLTGSNTWGNGFGAGRWYSADSEWNSHHGNASHVKSYGDLKNFVNNSGKVTTMVVTAVADNAGVYTWKMAHGGTTYIEAAAKSANNGGHFTLMKAESGAAYAVRVYNRALTDAELNYNHLIDILAVSEFDIDTFKGYSDLKKQTLARYYSAHEVLPVDAAEIEAIADAVVVNELYVTDGLVAAYTAYGAEANGQYAFGATADGAIGTWYDQVGSYDAGIFGEVKANAAYGWYVGANGGFYTDDVETFNNIGNRIDFPVEALKKVGSSSYMDAYTVEFIGQVDSRSMPIAYRIDKPAGVVAEDGSTTYTQDGLPNWRNGANVGGDIYYTFTGEAGTYTVNVRGNNKSITIDDSGVYVLFENTSGVTSVTVVTPKGVALTELKTVNIGNDAQTTTGFWFGSLSANHWTNLNGSNAWGNGYGACRWNLSNTYWSSHNGNASNGNYGGWYADTKNFVEQSGKITSMIVSAKVDASTGFHQHTLVHGGKTYFSNATPNKVLTNGDLRVLHGESGAAYAVRVYNRVLTSAESQLNHLVDLMLFYGIEITDNMLANKKSLSGVAAAVKDLELTNDTATATANKTKIANALMLAIPTGVKNAYDEAYVQDGLVGLFTAFDEDDASVKTEGVWFNKITDSGYHATLYGGAYDAESNTIGWRRGANGGIGYSMTATEWSNNVRYKTFGSFPGIGMDLGLLPDDKYTVETVLYIVGISNADGSQWTQTSKDQVSQYGVYTDTHSIFAFGPFRAMGFVAKSNVASSLNFRWCYADGEWNSHNQKKQMGNDDTFFNSVSPYTTINTMQVTMTTYTTDAGEKNSIHTLKYNGGSVKNTVDTAGVYKNNNNAAIPYHEETVGYFAIMSGVAGYVFSIRVYEDVLTDAQIKQNHFVDIAAYANYDLTEYNKLDTAAKATVHDAFANMKVSAATQESIALLFDCITGIAKDEFLYKTEGLVGLFTAFDAEDKTLDLNTKTWMNRINGNTAELVGNHWSRTENGQLHSYLIRGIGEVITDYTGKTIVEYQGVVDAAGARWKTSDDTNYIKFDPALLEDDFTVEYTVEMHNWSLIDKNTHEYVGDFLGYDHIEYAYEITADDGTKSTQLFTEKQTETDKCVYLGRTSVYKRSSYEVIDGSDRLGFLRSWNVIAGDMEGNRSNPVRWYHHQQGWYHGGWFSGNYTARASRDTIYTQAIMRDETVKNITVTTGEGDAATEVTHENVKTAIFYLSKNITSQKVNSGEYVAGGIKGDTYFPNDDTFYLFNRQPVTVYAIRVYNTVLSDADKAWNHAADIIAYVGADITNFKKLDAATQTEVMTSISVYTFDNADLAEIQALLDAGMTVTDGSMTDYDKLYVQDGLVGLYTAYGFDGSVSIQMANATGTWANKMDNEYGDATLRGGASWWRRTAKGGFGYTMDVNQWNSYNSAVGIDLPAEFENLADFTVEAVSKTKGITNLDGTRYTAPRETYKYSRFSTEIAAFRFGILNALYFVALHGADNMSFSTRWYYTNLKYGTHNAVGDFALTYDAATGTYSCKKGLENAVLDSAHDYSLRKMSKNLPIIALMSITKATSAEDGSVAYAVNYNNSVVGTSKTLNADQYAILAATTKSQGTANYFSMFNGIPADVYAIRVYNDTLTDAEKAQNHFADVAAFFGLDVSGVFDLSDEEKTTLYDAFAEFDFNSDKATAENVLKFYSGNRDDLANSLVTVDGMKPILTVPGYRVIFTVDKTALETFEANGYTIGYGAVVGVQSFGDATPNATVDGLTVSVDAKGNVTTANANAKVIAIVGGDNATGVYYDAIGTDLLQYSAAIMYNYAMYYGAEMIVRGYVTVTDTKGNTTVYYDNAEVTSMKDAANYFVNEYEGPLSEMYTYMSNPSLLSVLAATGIVARTGIDNEITIYVDAENGSDNNSGLTADKPLATLEAAYAAAKAHLGQTGMKGVSIKLSAGTHRVSSTLTLNASDIKASDYYFSVVGEGDDTVVTSTVALDKAWTTVSGYAAYQFDKVNDAYPEFLYVYANGKALDAANNGDNENYYQINSYNRDTKTIYVYSDDLDPDVDYTGAAMHIIIEWCFGIAHIASVDWDNETEDKNGNAIVPVILVASEFDQLPNPSTGDFITGREYWIEGAFDLLANARDTYYYDKANGLLYINKGVTDLAKVEVPTLDTIFSFNGVSGVTFSDMTITGTDFKGALDGYGSGQSAASGEKTGAIEAESAINFTVKNMVFTELAGDAIFFDGSVNALNDTILIDSCVFTGIGANAIRIGYDKGPYNRDVVISNNYIDGTGKLLNSASAVHLTYAADSKIIGNTIVNNTYSAITLGWAWNAAGDNMTVDYIRDKNDYRLWNVEIAYNYISDFMTSQRDGGAVYILGGNAANNEATYFNFMHDNYVTITEETGNHDGTRWYMGYYHDGASSNWHDYNNVVIFADDNESSNGIGVPIYVQQISGQETHNIWSDKNFAVGFGVTSGSAALPVYGHTTRMNAGRNILATDYIFPTLDALYDSDNADYAGEEFGVAGQEAAIIEEYLGDNAEQDVANIFATAGASYGKDVKYDGGLTVNGIVGAKAYVTDGGAIRDDITAGLPTPNFTVKFVDHTGEVVHSGVVAGGTALTVDIADDVKPSDAQYDYTFAGWTGYVPGMLVVSDVTFVADFIETVRSYTLTFVVGGETYYEVEVPYGAAIADYVPAEVPTIESTASHHYTFENWRTTDSVETGLPVGDSVMTEKGATYYAVFNSALRSYKATVVVYDAEGNEIVIASQDGYYNQRTDWNLPAITNWGDRVDSNGNGNSAYSVDQYLPESNAEVTYSYNNELKVVSGSGVLYKGSIDMAFPNRWYLNITEDTVFTLVFNETPTEHTATFKFGDNSYEASVAFGSAVTLPTEILEAAGDAEITVKVNGEVIDLATYTMPAESVTFDVSVYVEPAFAAGDLNGDETIDYTDLAWLLENLSGLREAAEFIGSGDLNGDDAVDYTDLAWLLENLSGLRDASDFVG